MFGYINGDVVLEEDIRINPRDIGILRGYAVFDVMPIFNKNPFLSLEHWERLARSANTLSLTLPISFEQWVAVIKDLLQKNDLQNASVRTVLTGGVSENAFEPNLTQLTFYVLMDVWREIPLEWFRKGVDVITKPYMRKFPEAKTVDYVFPISYLAEKKARGAVEIIYLSDGNLLEASTSNACIVSKGKIISPKIKVLGGITKKHVLSLAREMGFIVEERDVSASEMFAADELFLTGSYKNILPVVRVDEQNIGDGIVGNVTKKIAQAFWENIGLKPNPFL